VLFLIPVLYPVAPFLWLAFGAWMLALEYADYPMGNHGLRFPEQRRRLREQRLTSLGFGATALLLTMIPVVNFVAMPAAVAGATALWVQRFKRPDTQG
jgi:CysZ protein